MAACERCQPLARLFVRGHDRGAPFQTSIPRITLWHSNLGFRIRIAPPESDGYLLSEQVNPRRGASGLLWPTKVSPFLSASIQLVVDPVELDLVPCCSYEELALVLVVSLSILLLGTLLYGRRSDQPSSSSLARRVCVQSSTSSSRFPQVRLHGHLEVCNGPWPLLWSRGELEEQCCRSTAPSVSRA